MPNSIQIDAGDLLRMPKELRDKLAEWYKDGQSTPSASKTTPSLPPQLAANAAATPKRQVMFRELVNAGLLNPGDDIQCRTLTRQRRQGQPSYVKGATVAADGSVEFKGQKFYKPSKLAVAMVNSAATDPKQRAKALNGYDYLFAGTSNGLVSLDELRKKLLASGP
jgi:Restriction Enzyme Adenine Methylase Associated